MQKKSFKVLLVYPNQTLLGVIPINLALLSAYLKKAHFETKLFDASLYRTVDQTQDELRTKNSQVKKTDIDRYVQCRNEDVIQAFVNLVDHYKPDLIGMTLVDSTVPLGLRLLDAVKGYFCPKIIGGVAVTFNSHALLQYPSVDIACIGEGEKSLVELCQKLRDNKSYDHIKNLYIKKADGSIIKNPLRPLVNIDHSPYPDYSIFDDSRFYRPFHGRVVRMMPIDTDRGCPFTCTYCAAPSLREFFHNNKTGLYFRTKSISRVIKETKYLVKKYNCNFIWFSSETFFARSEEEMKDFSNNYIRDINLPFWCQTRLDTFTYSKTKLLKEMGCQAVSLGLEHGNEIFRKNVLKKFISNKTIIESFKLLHKFGIAVTVNNIIGFPDETRKLIFDTINLNRKLLPYHSSGSNLNVFIFTPFSGTPLRNYCLEHGYIKDSVITSFMYQNSVVHMPTMTQSQIEGLAKTAVLYIKLPKSYWPKIRLAEKNDSAGNQLFKELSALL